MESGELPLEDLIVRYEEGMKLVKVCQERLAAAEQRIEIITRNSAGKPVVKEFELPPPLRPSPKPKENPKMSISASSKTPRRKPVCSKGFIHRRM